MAQPAVPPTALPDVPLLGVEVQDALDAGLRKAGVFCSLCGLSAAPTEEGTPQTMTEYLIIEPLIGEGQKAVVNLVRVHHCRREDCDPSAVAAKASASRQIPAWELTDVFPGQAERDLAAQRTDPKYRRGDTVIWKGDGKRYVVMSNSHLSGGSWQYALSVDGTAAKALPKSPIPEADIDPLEGAGA